MDGYQANISGQTHCVVLEQMKKTSSEASELLKHPKRSHAAVMKKKIIIDKKTCSLTMLSRG